MPRLNQHKPLLPEEELRPLVEHYFHLGLSDPTILDNLRDHLDMSRYGLSLTSLKRLRKSWGLLGTRQQNHSITTIAPVITEIRKRFPSMGSRGLVHTLRCDYHMKVPEQLIQDYLRDVEPDALKQRSKRRFKRKRFWAAGVMDVWTFDQHDKWRRFGLWLHLGLEPFAGRLVWLKIWWTNRNPCLIASYYLQAARAEGGVPLVTQSDPGTENFGIANCHMMICHRLDPTLADTIQHRWCRDKMNIKAEAAWSQVRRQFTEGFENILDAGYNSDLYDADDPLERLVFRWLAIPWLQTELDTWRRRFNAMPRRADKNKVLPHGIPDLITAKPHRFRTVNFKVTVPPELFDEMEKDYANPDDPVFHLVPPAFQAHAVRIYDHIGQPTITSDTFWDIYASMVAGFRFLPDDPVLTASIQSASIETAEVELLSGLHDLPHGDTTKGTHGYYYMGGLEHPPQYRESSPDVENEDLREYACFTPSDSDNDL